MLSSTKLNKHSFFLLHQFVLALDCLRVIKTKVNLNTADEINIIRKLSQLSDQEIEQEKIFFQKDIGIDNAFVCLRGVKFKNNTKNIEDTYPYQVSMGLEDIITILYHLKNVGIVFSMNDPDQFFEQFFILVQPSLVTQKNEKQAIWEALKSKFNKLKGDFELYERIALQEKEPVTPTFPNVEENLLMPLEPVDFSDFNDVDQNNSDAIPTIFARENPLENIPPGATVSPSNGQLTFFMHKPLEEVINPHSDDILSKRLPATQALRLLSKDEKNYISMHLKNYSHRVFKHHGDRVDAVIAAILHPDTDTLEQIEIILNTQAKLCFGKNINNEDCIPFDRLALEWQRDIKNVPNKLWDSDYYIAILQTMMNLDDVKYEIRKLSIA